MQASCVSQIWMLLLQEAALRECTHSPQTTKLPAFIQRLASEYAADPDRRPDDLISLRSEDEHFGHYFNMLQPKWH